MRNLQEGYVKLFRSILSWEWFQNPKTAHLFIYCLARANFKTSKFEGITIARGEFVTSLPRLSEDTGLSVKEVRTALDHLKATGELAVKRMPKFSVVTVNNYDQYQTGGTQSGRQEAGKGQVTDSQPATEEQYTRQRKNGKKAASFFNFPEREGIDYEDLQNKLLLKNFSDSDENTTSAG